MPIKANIVIEANLATVRHGLVTATFGNASGIDRTSGLIAIKASGVPYDEMTADHMVLCDLEGRPHDNRLNPSSDLETHLVLYRAFPGIGAVIPLAPISGAKNSLSSRVRLPEAPKPSNGEGRKSAAE